MPLALLPFVLIFFPLNILEVHSSASASGRDTNTILPGQVLAGSDKLVCSTGKYALGFFQTQTQASGNSNCWYYLGIWIDRVPTITPVWVANEDDPIADLTTAVLAISPTAPPNPSSGPPKPTPQPTTRSRRCQTVGTSSCRGLRAHRM